jgi:hypothetical protein
MTHLASQILAIELVATTKNETVTSPTDDGTLRMGVLLHIVGTGRGGIKKKKQGLAWLSFPPMLLSFPCLLFCFLASVASFHSLSPFQRKYYFLFNRFPDKV